MIVAYVCMPMWLAVGLVLSIIMIKLLECWASRYPANSWQRLYVANSGDYGTPPLGRTWGYQVTEPPTSTTTSTHTAVERLASC